MISKLEATVYNNIKFDIDLNETKRVFCFIGENGIGKTVLLEVICKAIFFNHSLYRPNSNLFKKITIKKDFVTLLDKETITMPKHLKFNNFYKTHRDDTTYYIRELYNNINKETFDLPLIYINSRDRGIGVKGNTKSISLKEGVYTELSKVILNLLKKLNREFTETENIADWFISRIVSNNPFIGSGTSYYGEIALICEIMQSLDAKTFKNLIKFKGKGKSFKEVPVKVSIHDGVLFFDDKPFEHLPSGYLSIIKIFQEIINVYMRWYFEDYDEKNFSKILDRKAIICIDEIESHLHPKWESRIIPLLKEAFPNAIFYIATHSPLVVSSTEEGESYELYKDKKQVIKAKQLGNPKAWYFEDLLYQSFHVDKYFDDKNNENQRIDNIMKDFSFYVKQYLKNKNPEAKKNATQSYLKISENLSYDDPRRISLDGLNKLLNVGETKDEENK